MCTICRCCGKIIELTEEDEYTFELDVCIDCEMQEEDG